MAGDEAMCCVDVMVGVRAGVDAAAGVWCWLVGGSCIHVGCACWLGAAAAWIDSDVVVEWMLRVELRLCLIGIVCVTVCWMSEMVCGGDVRFAFGWTVYDAYDVCDVDGWWCLIDDCLLMVDD